MRGRNLNWAIGLGVVALIIGGGVRHSLHMRSLVVALTGTSKPARAAAAKELVGREQFLDSISAEKADIRARIVLALEDWGDPLAAKQAVAFLKDPERPVRDRVLVGVVSVGCRSAEALQFVANGLKDGDPHVRAGSVKALQVMAQPSSVEATRLLRLLAPSADFAAAGLAVQARSRQAQSEIVPKVIKIILKDDPGRASGAEVFSRLGPISSQALPALTALLDETDEKVRVAAVVALGKLADRASIPELSRRMTTDSAQVRRVAIVALAQIAAPECEPYLTSAVKNGDNDNEARAQATVGLGRISSTSSISTLISLLSDYDTKVQLGATAALARKGQVCVDALLSALAGASHGKAERIAAALAGIGSDRANAALKGLLASSDTRMRRAGALGLGWEGNAGGVGALVRALNSPDGETASAAAEALRRVGARATDGLIRSLASSPGAAFHASRAIVRQGQALVSALSSSVGRTSADAWVAVCLGEIGGEKAVATLRSMASTSTGAAQDAAKRSLSRLGLL